MGIVEPVNLGAKIGSLGDDHCPERNNVAPCKLPLGRNARVLNAHGHCQSTAVHHPSNEGATLLVVLALGRIIIQCAAHNGLAVARIHTYVPP